MRSAGSASRKIVSPFSNSRILHSGSSAARSSGRRLANSGMALNGVATTPSQCPNLDRQRNQHRDDDAQRHEQSAAAIAELFERPLRAEQRGARVAEAFLLFLLHLGRTEGMYERLELDLIVDRAVQLCTGRPGLH